MQEYSIMIPGDAVPQGRPRVVRIGGRTIAYDPPKSKAYKARVRQYAARNAPKEPLEGKVTLEVRIYRSVPKSWSKKKREAAYAGMIWPTTKPDVSNIVKGIEDALNGIWYKDDSQIVREYSMKQYAREPGVIVTMRGGTGNEQMVHRQNQSKCAGLA